MAVRFVVGRAGAGKTWHCLEAIRAGLRRDAARGPRLLLLVPEQGSFQMERALIETPDLPAYTRCEVLSFQRLAYRIFAETGADPRRGDQTIGGLGRMMVVRRLIGQERGGLSILGPVADKPGLVGQVVRAVDELMRENVEPAVLEELAARTQVDNPLGGARLSDLTRLYRAYLDYLSEDRLDPAQYLRLAAERLTHCRWIDGAEVYVDGFAGFTRQESALLVELARRAERVEIALLMDPAAAAVTSDTLPSLSFSLFARTERTLVQLRKDLRAAGVTEDEPLRLGDQVPRRFRGPGLAELERHVFAERAPKVDAISSPSVRVLELPDRRAEVDAAVTEILRLTREADPPMRYRDIAVIVRDLEAYHDLLSAAMRAHHIPCFIDRRQPTTHHPLIELVRSLLAVAQDDCRLDAVRLMLKTGLLPIAAGDADLLENYLLAHGIEGRTRWLNEWQQRRLFKHRGPDDQLRPYQQEALARVNRAREIWLELMGEWLDAATEPTTPGRQRIEALYACLDRLAVGRQLMDWAAQDEEDGLPDQAATHRQVWGDFLELLDEFAHALGDEPLTSAAFREIIEAGLGEFDLGLAPPTLDQVLVGAIERSRQPAIRAALVLGFDQTFFPRRRSEDPLLGDEEREALEAAGVGIGPSRRRQLLDERMVAYLALTRASQRLWISYPRVEVDGGPLEPSPFLVHVLEALPGLAVEKVQDPRQDRKPAWVNRVGELGGRLAAEFRYRPTLAADRGGDERAVWNALYEAGRSRSEWAAGLRRTLSGLAYRNLAQLSPSLAAQSLAEPFMASVSRLERFAACAFAHFAEYALRLEPRVEAEMTALEVGTLCHGILEQLIDGWAGEGRRLADIEDDQIAADIESVTERILPQLLGDLVVEGPQNDYLCDRSQALVKRVTCWQRDSARAGRFNPKAVEFPFGYHGPGNALTLATPKGRTIHLRGRIDRVDIAELADELVGMVIDYKTTYDRRLDLTAVYHGLSLQLVGYLLALQQQGHTLTGRPIRPVAAVYLPLLEQYETVAHPTVGKGKRYQWRGVLDLSALDVLDAGARDAGGSAFFSARITKAGEPYAVSDLASRDELAAVMRHVGLRMGELADGIIDGCVDVNPYSLRRYTPCTWCVYQSVCRYEIETQPPRPLDSYQGREVLALLSGGGGHA
ncbi:MAG: hypothetical protein GXY55_16795 [Phycisphaerae bacterium]|nr:hypothetical protein [Phycisphaerae bacterium]